MSKEQESQLAEQIAAAAAELYHAVLETTSIGIIAVDENDLIVYVNREACTMWGYEPGELIGNPISLLLPTLPTTTDPEGATHGILQRMAGKDLDVEGRSRAGDRIRVALSIRETRVGGTRLYTAALQDISARLQYQEALVKAREQAEDTARVRTALLTNIGHEIRTPLTGIRGFARVLLEESEGEHREFAQLIEDNSRRLLDTLNSVLEMVRLESSAPRAQSSTFDMVKVLRGVAAVMARSAPAENVQLTVESSHFEIVVHADEDSVYSILYNLIGNALKFTRRGSVRAALRALSDGVEIIVEDTGVGISDDFLPMLFEDFSQESTGLTRDFEGSGLGLAITKRAVDALGGEISVRSKKDRGSLFSVRLPLQHESSGQPVSLRLA